MNPLTRAAFFFTLPKWNHILGVWAATFSFSFGAAVLTFIMQLSPYFVEYGSFSHLLFSQGLGYLTVIRTIAVSILTLLIYRLALSGLIRLDTGRFPVFSRFVAYPLFRIAIYVFMLSTLGDFLFDINSIVVWLV